MPKQEWVPLRDFKSHTKLLLCDYTYVGSYNYEGKWCYIPINISQRVGYWRGLGYTHFCGFNIPAPPPKDTHLAKDKAFSDEMRRS